MRFKATVWNSMDRFSEDDDGSCSENFEICVEAKDRETLRKIKNDMVCIVEIRTRVKKRKKVTKKGKKA